MLKNKVTSEELCVYLNGVSSLDRTALDRILLQDQFSSRPETWLKHLFGWTFHRHKGSQFQSTNPNIERPIHILINRMNETPSMKEWVRYRVPCNEDLAEHPTCQVGGVVGASDLGLLGLLNGLYGVNEAGFGRIVWDTDTDLFYDDPLGGMEGSKVTPK